MIRVVNLGFSSRFGERKVDTKSITYITEIHQKFQSGILRLRRIVRRRAISELMGSLIMIAITLIAGVAAFGFVNGQTGNAASQLGNSAAVNENYLREKSTIALVNFDNNTGATNGLSIYVYNYGAVSLTINSISLQGPACVGILASCASPVAATIVYNRLSNSWTITGAGLTCVSPSIAGLGSPTPIAIGSLARVSLRFLTCSFVFAASSGTPLTNSFTFNVQGQFGTSASTIVTR